MIFIIKLFGKKLNDPMCGFGYRLGRLYSPAGYYWYIAK